jgi:hypothetical protein
MIDECALEEAKRSAPWRTGVKLEADVQAHISRKLRDAYEDVVGKAIPDRFLALLQKLEHNEASKL